MKIFRTWTFKWWEVGVIKVSLISLGILLGVYFTDFLSGLMWLWWFLFVITTVFFLIKMVREK